MFISSFSGDRSYRTLLSIALSIFVFAAPLSAAASVARGTGVRAAMASRAVAPRAVAPLQSSDGSEPDQKHEHNVDSFIVETINGVSTCREATPSEVLSTLPSPGDRGVPVREILNNKGQDQLSIQGGENSSTGLTINLLSLPQLVADPNRATVEAAFARAAAVWTSRIKSPITITFNIEYGVNRPDGTAFPGSVLGSTGSGTIAIDYPTARGRLVLTAATAGESAIFNSLPPSVVPTDTGDGSVVSVSRSLAQALGFVPLNPNEIVATIAFNKNKAFDFNPDDGIGLGQFDFVAVAAHEIGHALGFVSNSGDGSTTPLALWDLYRFRPSVTSSTFATAPRIMSIGGGSQVYFTGQTFVVGSAGTDKLGLSTGGPNPGPGDGDRQQSSHWVADDSTGEYIGIMDPTIAAGDREEATDNDFSTLETLGWNFVNSTPPPGPPPPAANDNFANAQVLSGCSGNVTGSNLSATKEAGEPNHLAPGNGGGTHSVWYQWQSPSTGNVTIDTAGSAYDTVLAVYTGTAANALSLIVNNDDIPDVPNQEHQVTSSVTFSASAGTIYRIAVDGFNNGGAGGDMGPFKLNWAATNCVVVSGSIQFASATGTFAESAGSAVINVTRTGDLSGSASISYSTSDGTATAAGSDYSPTSGQLNFAPGEASKNIIVSINDDSITETGETFNVILTNPSSGFTVGTPNTVVVTITDDDAVLPNTAQFSVGSQSVSETLDQTTKVDLTVTRTGDTSASASVEYATADGTASERSDYMETLGTLRFAAGETSKTITVFIVDDRYGEGAETFTVTLSNPIRCTLGSQSTFTVTINSNEAVNGLNPIKDASFNTDFFVRQHYVDFLNREGDAPGLAFWKNQIDVCETLPLAERQGCREITRINVSGSFFLSIEFEGTGYLVHRFYKAAYGDAVGTSTWGGTHLLPVPFVRLNQFLPDTQQIGRGVQVGIGNWQQQLETNKQAFALAFVQRPEFSSRYPTTLSPTTFVDNLFATAGVTPSAADQQAAIDEFGGAPTTADMAARGRAMRRVAENSILALQEKNKAFVLMQYFGYLRRDPNDTPDADHTGYDFWLIKLNQFNGNYISAEMVKAFITSAEYEQRFGQ